MAKLATVYDGPQHCVALDAAKGKAVAMDCPYTGKGEELSPGELLEAALGGCMLIAMGALAQREGIDLTGTRVEVETETSPPPKIVLSSVRVDVTMPKGLDASQRTKLERASDSCPIKHAFSEKIAVTVSFHYPD